MIIKVGGGLEPLGPIGVYAYGYQCGRGRQSTTDCCVENHTRPGVSADHQRDVADAGGTAQGPALLPHPEPDDRQQLQSAGAASARQGTSPAAHGAPQTRFASAGPLPPQRGILEQRDPPFSLSVRLSVPWRSCLGYRHAGCLQLSHRRPPEMRGLRTRPRTDVDPPRFLLPSNCYRRVGAYRLAAPGAIPCWVQHTAAQLQ